MSDFDVVEKVITDQPEVPVYIPYAGNTSPGIASFNSRDFIVEENGTVQLSKDVKQLTEDAENARDTAVQKANEAEQSASNAKISETNAKTSETNAKISENKALDYMGQAKGSAANALIYKNEASQSATDANNSKNAAEQFANDSKNSSNISKMAETNAKESEINAKNSETNAKNSEINAKNSEINAQKYRDEAYEYAKKHYKIVQSYDDLPIPGDTVYIYLVPVSNEDSSDNYGEYIWIDENQKYEFVGTINDVDLTDYAKKDYVVANSVIAATDNLNNLKVGDVVYNIHANSVLTVKQTLTKEQQAQARSNIDAQKTAEFMTSQEVDEIFNS